MFGPLWFGLAGFFLLSWCATGETRVMVSSPANATIVALLGDDVILPCHLANEVDIKHVTVEWSKPGLQPEIIYLYRDGFEIHEEQNLAYAYRTTLFSRELDTGNVSLKLGRVNHADEGKYRCFIPSLKKNQRKEATIQLIVGAVSLPVVSIVDCEASVSMLQCDARGWYPKPVLEWLDDEGHVLPNELDNRENVENGLYNLMSRVKVQKTTTNRFTCRVRQLEINQIRVTEIHVPDNCMESCTPAICIAIFATILSAVAAVIIIQKWKDITGMLYRCCAANSASEPQLEQQKTLLEPNANPSGPVLDPDVNTLQNKDLNPSNQTYSDNAKPSIPIGEDNYNISYPDVFVESTLPSSSSPTKHFEKKPKQTHQPNSNSSKLPRCASHSAPRIVPDSSKLPRCASHSGSRPVLNASTFSSSASQSIPRLPSFSTKNRYNVLSDLDT